ncbi:hypothetical protein EVC24_129 [Rhizobium phage RHph_I4]|nr:hypothetical protein EVC24_129 [Rhizobium phage RHph_I4]
MAIQIKTERYEFAHGKAPKGAGSWAFIQEACFNHDAAKSFGEHTIFAPGWMTYREACAWVRKLVRTEGFRDATIHVAA